MFEDYLKNISEERLRIWEGAKALTDAAATEKRELTSEESAEFDRRMADIDRLDAQGKDLRERDQREREADEARAQWAPIIRPDVQEQRDAAHADSIMSFLKGDGPRYMDFDLRGVAREKRALRTGQEFRIAQEDVTTSGGNTVPTSFLRELYDFLETFSGIRQTNVTVLTTSSGEALQIPKVTTHGTAALKGEGTALTANDPQFGQLTLNAWKYGQLLQVSNELIADTGVDILSFIAKDCGRAIGRATDTDYVTGTGSSKPQGIVPVAGTGVTSQTGATGLPSYANLVDLVYSVNQEYRANGAQWFMKDASAGALRKLVDSQNRPLWEPSLQVGQPGNLLGYPVITDPNMAAFATAAATGKPILFGDFSSFYIRDVGTVRLERSDDYAFDKDLVTWRCIFRTDSDLVDLTGALKALANPST